MTAPVAATTTEAPDELIAALAAQPDQPAAVYLELTRQLYRANRHVDGERWAGEGLSRHPEAFELWNIRGVFLRTMLRRPEALAALERALALKPDDLGARANRGSVLLDLGDTERATEAFGALVAEHPANTLLRHQLGRALEASGRRDDAAATFRTALAQEPRRLDTWLQLARLTNNWRGLADAEAVVDEALAVNPGELRLLEAKGLILRGAGERARTLTFLQDLVERHPDVAWIRLHLGDMLAATDRAQGLAHLRRALELEPGHRDHMIALIQVLERGQGADETVELEEANRLARQVIAIGWINPAHAKVLGDVFGRVIDFDRLDALGDFDALGRAWASAGIHVALLRHMSRAQTAADRVALVEHHRIWGRTQEARAAGAPIVRPARGPRTRLRLGIMSSDLRRHAVTRFASPLFDHVDRDQVELYAYSFYGGAEDPVQARISSQVHAFRWRPDIGVRAAAQMIADDRLDALVEIGGSTDMNKLEVMAYRPAPLQLSWLGYPHSAGLSTIDYLIGDAFNLPADPGLMMERPLTLPRSWTAFGPAYGDQQVIAPQSAEARHGFVTFGTANNPYKYTHRSLRAWARAVARVPNARFAFIRPEAASTSFRQNVLAEFAAEGVDASRLVFHAVRGGHFDYYNEIDIALDAFPLTGGVTTVDSLWMGVPVVTLVGEAFFERLSYAILSHVGLGDLCARTVDDYVDLAVALANDGPRRRELRQTLRQRVKDSPLGRPEAWARDFYAAISRAVEAG